MEIPLHALPPPLDRMEEKLIHMELTQGMDTAKDFCRICHRFAFGDGSGVDPDRYVVNRVLHAVY